MGAPDFLELRFRELADMVAARTPVPAGGPVAALVLTLAAALAGMAARFSDGTWDKAGPAAERADLLRARAAPLARADADAYAATLALLRAAGPPGTPDRERRRAEAVAAAADVPLAIAEVAAGTAELAATVAQRGNQNVRGDAVAAALLADCVCRLAAALVEIDVAGEEADPRLQRARALTALSAGAAARALP